MKHFKDSEKQHQTDLLSRHSELFYHDKGNGRFMGKERPFVLQDGLHNLYESIQEKVLDYFRENNISWWHGEGPSGHILSSQVACLNHLFPIRENKEAVLEIAKMCCKEVAEVLPLPCDSGKPAYIGFEVVSDRDHLNEGKPRRGALCTSIDAFIYARDLNGRKILLPIEWKYTELYETSDKSHEDRPGEPAGSNGRGRTRVGRYAGLINASQLLRHLPDYYGSVYFQEPFYQLMRQTLWTEQVLLHSSEESLKAEDYIHVHVVPQENWELLHRKYKVSGEDMETTWKGLLQHPDKYVLVDPKQIAEIVGRWNEGAGRYLKERYWTI